MGGRGSAIEAYDAMASIYDEFNACNDYEKWLGEALLPELEKRGLRQTTGRVLDVGCGTGRALPPLVKRGWNVTGCDSSKAMLEQALKNHGPDGWAGLEAADARSLPEFGDPFDLIIALNDVVNYLTEDGDLERFFDGVKKNLAPHGLVCFDANTLGYLESSFAPQREDDTVELGSAPVHQRGWKWSGLTAAPKLGGIFEAELTGDGIDGVSIHRERHWPPEQIEGAMLATGLSCLAVLGQREDGEGIHLDVGLDEQRHYKVVYIGGHCG